MDQQKFEEKAKEVRKVNTDALTSEVLAKMLEHDVHMFDTHYIRDRVIQIIQATIKKLTLKSKAIEKQRQAFLDVLINGMKAHPFTIEDEIKTAKEALKKVCKAPVMDKQAKQKVKDRLEQLERVRDNQPKDVTETRNVNCEPVCQHVAKTILSREWLLKDPDYVKGVMELDNELLISIGAMGYVTELFEQLYNSIDKSYLLANEKHWGVPRHKIKMSQLDNRIKE